MNFIRLGSGLLSLLLFVTLVQSSATTSTHDSSATKSVKLVIGVDGGTESIRACCFDATTGVVIGKSCAVPYPTYHPQPGWAEQDPNDWYENLGTAVRGAVDSLKTSNHESKFEILGICLDTTCCSVVALDDEGKPLRNTLLWMDARSAPQTEQILDKCRGDPALNVNCGGEGPLSAEWMTPKGRTLLTTKNETKTSISTLTHSPTYSPTYSPTQPYGLVKMNQKSGKRRVQSASTRII